MHAYPIDIELVRFAFILGIVASVVMYERVGLTSGSLVAAGYIGIFVGQPMALAMTFVIALLSYFVMKNVVPKFAVVYGRTRFAILLIICVVLESIALVISANVPLQLQDWRAGALFAGIGLVIPALIAHDMGRQGVRKTMVASAGAGLIVVAVVWSIALAVPTLRDAQTAFDPGLAYDPRFLPLAAFFSILAAACVQARYGLRSCGIIGAAYIALVVNHPLSLLVLAGTGALTFLIVRYGIMPFGIVFGRRKFALMLTVGAMCGWLVVLAGDGYLPNGALGFQWVPIAGLLLPGLLGNDFERVGISRTVAGLGLTTSFVLPATLMVQRIVTGHAPVTEPFLVLWLLITGFAVFGLVVRTFTKTVFESSVVWRARVVAQLAGA